MIRGVPCAAKKEIERLQPYHSIAPDDHPLAILRDLNNTDKHRNLLVVADVIAGATTSIPLFPEYPPHVGMVGPVRLVRLENNAEIQSYEAPAYMKVNIEPSCGMALTDVGSAKLKSVVPCLKELRDFVRTIVDEFDSKFL